MNERERETMKRDRQREREREGGGGGGGGGREREREFPDLYFAKVSRQCGAGNSSHCQETCQGSPTALHFQTAIPKCEQSS